MPSHNELIGQAKQRQQQQLQASATASQQLNSTVRALISSNSSNSSQSCSSVLDKITTIQQLDKQINKQLQDGIAANYERLLKSKKNLDTLLSKNEDMLNYVTSAHQPKRTQNVEHVSVVDGLQRKAELVDQDLRILENTLKFVQQSRSSS
ncbi:biogenesis of lysosome-related organelles complex 1 subunit Bls1p [[Candida] railenensis]|uniref:Biogenesis of lysosome-related organelles complex 1 subunit Bls1p n=1 Tax=[Candida] railenensis TaxID=45579 RepID=A0A9P0QUL0_9ASCO|nr:biogenesis of lysosome-related organelles complex 1 subunit Bls1p [[Candida] railenensis]